MPEYMEISFLAKSVFGDALKSSLPMIHVFGVLPKIANLAFCQKLKLIFGIFLLLYSLERKVAFYEEKELQRSKMYKEVCE